jgi:hypothetical protein
MASVYATKLAEGFSQKLIQVIYENAPIDEVVNRDYEGEINAVGSKLNILTLARITEKTYTGTNLTADDLTEVNAHRWSVIASSILIPVSIMSKRMVCSRFMAGVCGL